jgi:hypothetical protein
MAAKVTQPFMGFDRAVLDRLIPEYIASLRNWVQVTESSGRWAQCRDELFEGAARADAVKRVNGVLVRAQSLSGYLCARGALRVIDQDAAGWNEVRLSLRYLYWSNRGEHAVAMGQPYSAVTALHGTYYRVLHASLAAYLLDDTEVADWFFQLIVKMVQAGVAAESAKHHAYSDFVHRFATAYLEGRPPQPGDWATPSPYSDLVDAWPDIERFRRTIPLALDYHLWRGDERAKARNPEKDYHDPGYLMFPVPVLAMLKLRQQYHPAESLEVDHPLLQMSICKPVSRSVPPTDETTDVLERAVTGLEAERMRQFPHLAKR